jgi:hypothetical protein
LSYVEIWSINLVLDTILEPQIKLSLHNCVVCIINNLLLYKILYKKRQKRAGVSGLSQTNLTLPWTNRRNSSAPVALRYFAQLDLPTVRALHAIYRIDFQMFGYDVEPYFQLFQP